ncbi:MAG: hypothetical protein SH868_17365 [Bythopirellula sp.]|nr:hypothetical protein [Bythopirellula sp.]
MLDFFGRALNYALNQKAFRPLERTEGCERPFDRPTGVLNFHHNGFWLGGRFLMGRTTEGPWYRRSTGCYMCTFAGKQFKLLKAEENSKNKKIARQKYHELMLATVQAPDTPDADVASLCDAYLDWAEQNLKPRTYKGHKWYLQNLVDDCGRRLLSELKTIHITEWLGTKKDGVKQRSTTHAVLSSGCLIGVSSSRSSPRTLWLP